MRRCFFDHGCYCRVLSRTGRRLYVSIHTDAASKADTLALKVAEGDIAHDPESGPDAETGAGIVEKPRRPRRRPLPLSPVMDPVYRAAKQEHHQPKAEPSKDLTPLQRQLARCPYALALATPVRMCHLSQTRLPSFFLQDFSVVAHPDTNEPWYVPRSLSSPRSTPPAAFSRLNVPAQGTAVGGNSWVLARHTLLRGTVVKGSGLPVPPVHRLARHRQANCRAWPKNVRWRSDIDLFVLELMRRRIVERLVYLYGRKRGYLVAAAGWQDAMKKKQVGAFLWLGRADAVEEIGGPGEFATLDMHMGKKSKLPVHNLPTLLGQAHVEALRAKIPKIFDAEVVVVKDKRRTTDVCLRLWKLQGFYAQHEQIEVPRTSPPPRRSAKTKAAAEQKSGMSH